MIPDSADILQTLRAHLAQSFAVERELGKGGMGQVFLGRDIALDRPVAIKVIAPELAFAEASRERFLLEARTIAKLRHPGIVTVYAAGEASGLLYFVMEYIEGESLRDRLERTGRCDDDSALRLLGDLAHALDYAHAHGVVHRDVKPENILLERDTGRALLMDFGVARALGQLEADPNATGTGFVVGSPRYMSPEQAAGERDLDGRSDLYSLGLVAYEIFAGDAPFTGSSPMAVLSKQLIERPVPIAERNARVPPHVAAAIDRALEKDPAERWATAGEFAAALEVDGHGVTSGRSAAVIRRRTARRRRALVGAAIVAIATLVPAVMLARRDDGVPEGVDPRKTFLVTPFEILSADPQLGWLREGSVSMLTLNLGQWSDLSVVGYERSLDLLREAKLDTARRIGLGDAQDMARRAGAWTVVMGQVASPGDSLLVTARLFDVASGRQLDEAQRSIGRDEDPRPLFDALTRDLLDLAGAPHTVSISRLTETTTHSVEAYRAYLEGVRALSRWQIARADTFFTRATAADSNFGLAHFRHAMALGWRRTGDSVHRAVVNRTDALADRLPPREQTLARGYVDLARALDADKEGREAADSLFRSAQQRYTSALQRDSTDADAWFGLADALWHHRVDGWGTPKTVANWSRAYRAFDRTLQLDSTYYLAYTHKLDLLRQAASQMPGLMFEGDSLYLVDSAALARPAVAARYAASRRRAQEQAVREGRGWTRAAPSAAAYQQLAMLYAAADSVDSAIAVLREGQSNPEARSDLALFMIAALEASAGPGGGLETLRAALRGTEPRLLAEESGIGLLEVLFMAGRAAGYAGSLHDAALVATLAKAAVPPAGMDERERSLPDWWLLGTKIAAGMPAASLRRDIDAGIRRIDTARTAAGEMHRFQAAATLYVIYLATRDPQHRRMLGRWLGDKHDMPELDALAALQRRDTAAARRIAADFPSPDSLRASPLARQNLVRWIARAQVLEEVGDLRRALAVYRALEPRRFAAFGMADPSAPLYSRSLQWRAELQEALGDDAGARLSYQRFLAAYAQADSSLLPLRQAAVTAIARIGDQPGVALPAGRRMD